MRDLILPVFVARDHILWRHHVANHPNGVSLCCPLRMINSNLPYQLYHFVPQKAGHLLLESMTYLKWNC